MKTQFHVLKNLKTKLLSKSIKLSLSFFLLSLFLFSCKKENKTPDTWQFTKLVNATLDNSGNMVTLDFYQKKGNQWRIVQFEPDDYFNFFLKSETAITPDAFQLPIDNPNAFMTNNVRLFDANGDKVYNQGNLKWFMGEPIQFKTFNAFTYEFPNMPDAKKSISKFSAATYSSEQAYDNNAATNTYIFYDFPNQKYLYYGFRSGADLILENTLPVLCTTCGDINWSTIDAVTCSDRANESQYYFFDFDAQKMYFLSRENKNTNHPSFIFESNHTYDFAEAFKGKAGTPSEFVAFDFSK